MIVISSEFEYVSFRNINGKYHRENGPAVLHSNSESWYKNGIRYNYGEPIYTYGNLLDGFVYDIY